MVSDRDLVIGVVERMEEVAALLERRASSPGRAALLLRQRAAEARQAVGRLRAPKPARRLGEASRG